MMQQFYRNASDNAAETFHSEQSPSRQMARDIAADVSRRAQLNAAMMAARKLGERGRYEPTEADLKAQRTTALQAEVRAYLADLQTIARIKMDCNPMFAEFGLHLVRLPKWRPA
jgi:hypothetical protein